MSKKTTLAIGVIALASTAGIVYSAYAYQGDPGRKGPNYSPQRHEAMQKAFENNDYDAWKTLMNGRGRVMQVVNEENFAQFAQMHRLMLAGKYDEANKIREELGLRTQNRSRNMDGHCNFSGGKYRKSGNGLRGNFQN